jgi:hypothetical protein
MRIYKDTEQTFQTPIVSNNPSEMQLPDPKLLQMPDEGEESLYSGRM